MSRHFGLLRDVADPPRCMLFLLGGVVVWRGEAGSGGGLAWTGVASKNRYL